MDFTLRCCFCMNLSYLPPSLPGFKNGFWLSGLFFLARSGLVACPSSATYFERGAEKGLGVLVVSVLSTSMKGVGKEGKTCWHD